MKCEDIEGLMLLAEEYMMEHILKHIKNTLKSKCSFTYHWKKFLHLAIKYSHDDMIDHWVNRFDGEKWKIDESIPYEINVKFMAKAISNVFGDAPSPIHKLCHDLMKYKNKTNLL